MSDKPRLILSEKESLMLRDLCFARMKTLGAGNPDSLGILPVHNSLGETEARMFATVFNFFCRVYSDNAEAVKWQVGKQHAMGPHAGMEYHDGMLRDYQCIMDECMRKGEYLEEDIQKLRSRVKGFIREQKAPPARTLYIADCHFYHDRICREMDNRGFSGYEEMNGRMIAQWNRKVNANLDKQRVLRYTRVNLLD